MLFSNTFLDRHKNLISNFLKILISFTIYFNSFTLANAATVGGWSLGSPVAQGAKAIVEGTKQVVIDGRNYIKKGTAVIAPNASQVAKVLARGGAGYALSVAVEQLLGAVDWVLDPANNQIKYYKDGSKYSVLDTGWHDSRFEACKAYALLMGKTESDVIITSDNKCRILGLMVYSIATNAGPKEEKTLPLSTVAAQVISNAESSSDQQIKVGAQAATTAAAADIIAEAETDSNKARPIVNQIETSAQTRPADADAADKAGEAAGEAAPQADPVTGEKAPPIDFALEFPIFCDWVPIVCEAAQTVISFPNTLTDWWTTANSKADEWATSISTSWAEAKEYFKEETPEKENTEIDIEEIPVPSDTVTVSIGQDYCPAMSAVVLGKERDFTPVWLCELATGMKSFFVALGFFSASLIVGRRK